MKNKKGYYDFGNLKYVESYKNGVLNGTSKYYFQNGKIYTEGTFFYGLKNGTWKTYYENSSFFTDTLGFANFGTNYRNSGRS